MSENVTTKRYAGTFVLNGKQFYGEVVHNKENGKIILALTRNFADLEAFQNSILEDQERDRNSQRTIRYPRISGTLHNGETISLLNCRRFENFFSANNFTHHIKLVADSMIWGEIQKDDPKFSRFSFVVENGLLWFGKTQIVNKIDYKEHTPQVFFQSNSHDQNRTWSGIKIKFSTMLDYTDLYQITRKESCEVVERLKIAILPTKKMKVSEFLEIRDQILAMISFAIKGKLNITWQYFCNSNEYNVYETGTGKDRDYKKYTIVTNERHFRKQKQNPDDFNFCFSDLPYEKDLGQEMKKLLPVFNLYTSFFNYSNMPLEMLFLNVTQALETLHARVYYNKYKDMYNTVVARFGNLDPTSVLHQQLLPCNNGGNIVLSARLNDLFALGSNQLFKEFYVDQPDYAEKIVKTRNYYTHYSKELEHIALRGNDLFDAIQILKWLLEYHVCTSLSVKNTEEKIRYKMYPDERSKKAHDILQAYYDTHSFDET